MATHVVSLIVQARGADKHFDKALREAADRLWKAADSIQNGQTPADPGIDFRILDPGGGGGPCTPVIRTQDFDVSDSGLPEARSRDD